MKHTFVSKPQTLEGLKVINDEMLMVDHLQNGETIAHFEWGNSMTPILVNGQYCRLTPLNGKQVNVGDAVFCHIENVGWMTHLVLMVNQASGWCLIGSTYGDKYGWTNQILAIATPMPFIEVWSEETEK